MFRKMGASDLFSLCLQPQKEPWVVFASTQIPLLENKWDTLSELCSGFPGRHTVKIKYHFFPKVINVYFI